jgi:hypothetical protein
VITPDAAGFTHESGNFFRGVAMQSFVHHKQHAQITEQRAGLHRLVALGLLARQLDQERPGLLGKLALRAHQSSCQCTRMRRNHQAL